MAPEGLGVARSTLLRWLIVFALFELGLGLGMVFVSSEAGLVDSRVALAFVVLRWAVVGAYVRAQLRPLAQLWGAGAEASDAMVLAASVSLETFVRRLALTTAAGWAIVEISWLLLGLAGAPLAPPYGRAELVAALLFICATPGFAPLNELLMEALVGDVRAEVGLLARGRGLPVRPSKRSFIRPFVGTAVWLLLGSVLTLGGATVARYAGNQRAHTMELELERLRHSHLRIEQGELPLAGVELRAGLSEAQAAVLDRETMVEPGEPIMRFDFERDLVVGALMLDDGRVLVSETTPHVYVAALGGLLMLVALLGAPLFGSAFWLAGQMLTAPLVRLRDAARAFVERGDVGELERLLAVRDDEIGQAATSFVEVFEVLSRLEIAAEAVSAGDLSVRVEHPGRLHDAFRGMLVRLNETVGGLRGTSLELASAAAEINTLLEEQEEAAIEQAHNIQRVAQTVSSLAGSAEQIAAAARGVRSDAEDAVETTDASAAEIVALRQHTAAIAELLVGIAEVASRSDLLALNGSLEATRAGEAGRGFALVAAEMRRLAERVAGTVVDVRGQVADVEASSSASVAATEQSRALAKRTASAAREIDQLTAAQSHDTEEASTSVQAAAEMVVRSTSAMSQVRAATAGLHAHARELEELLRDFSLGDQPEPEPQAQLVHELPHVEFPTLL